MLNKIWCYKNRGTDVNEITDFSTKYKLPPVITTVLFNRGIKSADSVTAFFKKGLDTVHNPMEMNDMSLACERIAQAIENKEKVVVYGDYVVYIMLGTTENMDADEATLLKEFQAQNQLGKTAIEEMLTK